MINEIINEIRTRLEAERPADGVWRGRLSSSAISTATAVFALYSADKERYAAHIKRGVEWLRATMLGDGSWGDSPESPPNMTATLLAYAALCAADEPPLLTQAYLTDKFGGATDRHITSGVLAHYGKDLTFSAPILTMCALAGVVADWNGIPQLPFEAAALPQRLFRFLRLPVVSYAIPALIAVGILRYKKGRKSLFSSARKLFVKPTLKTLEKLQPSHGGFLEAAPLTAFVAICMCGAGYRDHAVTQRCAEFLINTVREDGSWPIDTDLSCWVTSLAARALGDDVKDKAALAETIKRNAFAYTHPFTGAQAGGWGWTDLPGSVPDADDTAGALTALHALLDGAYCPEIGKGVEWLLALQNRDGGMPTFCKGWSRLPFDRSSPDISAHSLLAFSLWMDALPVELQEKCRKAMSRLIKWMQGAQAANGSWTPLWFGDQDADDERAPVYGTAVTVEYLSRLAPTNLNVAAIALKGVSYLLSAQNEDGGWGGAENVPSKITFTARALSALAEMQNIIVRNEGKSILDYCISRASDYICRKWQEGELYRPEPIGLYFARLWYSEKLYNLTFVLNALKKINYHL